ncbi:IS629 protein [Escherichia coli M863]|nr:IS629 protein [Escherichia coli M863]
MLQRFAVRRRLCVSGYTSMSGILGTVMVAECQRLKVPERENCEVRRSNDMVGPV